jgi:hypothetical protein
MTFGSTFGRVFSPTFHPKSQAKKGGGWWDLNGTITSCVAAYQPKGAASYAASKVNLANSGTYDATDGAAYPTWDASTGWKFNGSTQYLKCGFTPTTQSHSAIIRFNDMQAGNGALFGAWYSRNVHYLIQPYHSEPGCRYWSGSNPLVTSVIATGVLAIAGNKAYKNGTAETGTLPTGSSSAKPECYIGGYNSNNTFTGASNVYITAFAYYSATLTATEVANLTTAMNAL